jgi:hypothetical protein
VKVKTKMFSSQESFEEFLNKIGWDRVLQVCMNDRQILVIYKIKE